MISGTRYRLTLEIARQGTLAQEIARAQAEIATGKKILAPSDDPAGAARVAEIGRTQANEAAWSRNLDTAAALAARADTVLGSAASVVDRAKELMLAAASATASAENRATIAAELRGLAAEIQDLRATRDPRGEPLFRTNGALEIPVGPDQTVTPVATRNEAFGAPVNIAGALFAAADAAVEPDPALRDAAVQASLAGIDAAAAQVAAVRSDQGVRAARIDNLRERLAESRVQLTEQRSAIEGTDITEAVARLESKRLSLQAAQAVFARIHQSTLFDLLR